MIILITLLACTVLMSIGITYNKYETKKEFILSLVLLIMLVTSSVIRIFELINP